MVWSPWDELVHFSVGTVSAKVHAWMKYDLMSTIGTPIIPFQLEHLAPIVSNSQCTPFNKNILITGLAEIALRPLLCPAIGSYKSDSRLYVRSSSDVVCVANQLMT